MGGLRRERSSSETKVFGGSDSADGEDTPTCNRVRVFARVRPSNQADQGAPGTAVDLDDARRSLRVVATDALERAQREKDPFPEAPPEVATPVAVEAREFALDGVFAQDSSQDEVFQTLGRPVLSDCMAGINGTVLAYGQTGSGKTYSLLNSGPETGFLPRLIADLFGLAQRDVSGVVEIEAAAVQIYNEQVDDLLHPDYLEGKGWNLGVIEGGGVPGLTWLRCSRPDQLLAAFTFARTNLVYAETKLNKASSRSHAVFQVRIRRQDRAKAGPGGLINRQAEYTSARLNVVDLAGSERIKKSGAEGVQLREATMINKSLLALGNVVSALAAKKPHVPLRDSKLTRILDGSIGGNCRTVLLVCVSPALANAQETLTSLEFASRAMRVEVNARVNKCMVELDSDACRSSRPASARARPPREPEPDPLREMSERIAKLEASLAESAEGRAELEEAKSEAEHRCRCWKERAESLEKQMQRLEEESKQLHQALGRSEKRMTEIRVSSNCKGEELETIRKAAADAEARAARAEERAIMAVANLEAVRQEASADAVAAAKRAQALEDDLRAAREELVQRAAAEGAAAAREREAAAVALQAAAAKEEGLRGQSDQAQHRMVVLEAQLSASRNDVLCHQQAVDAARQELEIFKQEAAVREEELTQKMKQAIQLGEDLSAELKREKRRAAATEEAYARLNEGHTAELAKAAALEAQAAMEAAEWAGEREGLEAAHQHLLDTHRADWRARMRDKRGDFEGRLGELRRESAYLRKRLEEKSIDLAQAEARWKRAREDAVKEEREHHKALKRKAEAAFKAERDLSAKREAELLEAHAKLARRLAEREGDEDDKDCVISEQRNKIEELRWELDRRAREADSLRQELKASDKKGVLGIQGFAPPLPGQKNMRRPSSAVRARPGPRSCSASPRASPVQSHRERAAAAMQTDNTDPCSATSSPATAQSPRHGMPNLSPLVSPASTLPSSRMAASTTPP